MGWGTTELIIVLVIVLVLFGGARLAGLGRSLGSAISEFKSAVRGDEEKNDSKPGAEKTEQS